MMPGKSIEAGETVKILTPGGGEVFGVFEGRARGHARVRVSGVALLLSPVHRFRWSKTAPGEPRLFWTAIGCALARVPRAT